MKKALVSVALLGVSTLGLAISASAAPEVSLYDGKTLAQDNLSIGPWGGGTVEDSTELFLAGGHSLKVTTLDLYQGAKINFTAPVVLSGSGRMFQLTLQRGAVTLHYDPQADPGAVPPSSPQNTPGGYGGRGGRRGGGRGGFGGGQGGFGGGQGGFGGRGRGGRGGGPRTATPLIPLITKLRLEFTLTDGRKADVVQAIPETADPVAGTGWYSVNVPLTSLKFGTGGSAQLQSVTIGGDQFGVFFIGQMQLAPPAAAPAAPAKPALAGNPEEDNAPPADNPGFPQPEGQAPPPGGQNPVSDRNE